MRSRSMASKVASGSNLACSVDGAARAQRRRRLDVQAADVEQRQRRQHAVVGGHARACRRCASAFAASASWLSSTPLGRPVEPEVQHSSSGASASTAAAPAGGVALAPAMNASQPVQPAGAAPNAMQRVPAGATPLLGAGRGEALVDDEQRRRAIVQHRRVLGRREPPVQRHEDRAQPRAGEQRGQHLRAVQAEPGDAVAARHACRRQRGGDLRRTARPARRRTASARRSAAPALSGVRPALAAIQSARSTASPLFSGRRPRAPPPSPCRRPRSR